jgi:hypothetical protein
MLIIILLLLLAYLLYNNTLPWKNRGAIFLLLLLYPFFISSLQDNLRFLYNFLFSSTTNINTSASKETNSDTLNNYKSDPTKRDEIQYNQVKKENSMISTTYTNLMNNSNKNDRQSIFKATESYNLNFWNFALLILFYFVVAIFIYYLFTSTVLSFSIYLKIVIVLIIVPYPFYCDIVANFIIYLFSLLYSLVMVKTYKDPKSKYDTWNQDLLSG